MTSTGVSWNLFSSFGFIRYASRTVNRTTERHPRPTYGDGIFHIRRHVVGDILLRHGASVLITPTTIRKLLDDFSTLPLAAVLLVAATASPAAVCSALNLRDIRISTRLKGQGDLHVPVESLLEDMYIRLSIPFIFVR